MKKFIWTKSGNEAKIGDVVNMTYTIKHKLFGNIKTVPIKVPLTEDILDILIKRGSIKEVEITEDFDKIFNDIMDNLTSNLKKLDELMERCESNPMLYK